MMIVIDGPAGSGKSSTARAVAERTGFEFLDSGAFYRAVTLLYLQCNRDQNSFFEQLKTCSLNAGFSNGVFRIQLNGVEITDEIRKQEVSESVSEVAALPEARDVVNGHLREFVKTGSFIADGRDLGTAVFPNAEFKFFFEASAEKRAERRQKELLKAGQQVSFEAVLENIKSRDFQDSNREVAPLRKADDAIVLDTGSMTLEEQIQFVIHTVKA